MRRNSISIKLVLGGLLLGLIGWGLYASIEFYEETEESGWSIDALRNPYLAAQKFISASGIEVTDVDSLLKLEELSTLGTLFFSDANQVQTPRQLQQVMDWLDVGGNVIYTADTVAHSDDLLLKEFSVEVEWREYETEEAKEETSLSETMREYNRQIEDGKSREEIASSPDEAEEAIHTYGGVGTGDVEDNRREQPPPPADRRVHDHLEGLGSDSGADSCTPSPAFIGAAGDPTPAPADVCSGAPPAALVARMQALPTCITPSSRGS